MRIKSEDHGSLSRERARTLAIALTFAGVIGLIVAYWVTITWLQAVIYSVASAILSVGVVSVLYEVRLRQTFEHELMRLVGIEKSLAEHQVVWAGAHGNIDWTRALAGASDFHMLIADPRAWLSSHWNQIIAGSEDRPVRIHMFFPSFTGAEAPTAARFLGISQDDLKSSVEGAKNLAESEWKAADKRNELLPGSEISIRYVDGLPSYDMIRANQSLYVRLVSCTRRRMAETGFAIQFSGPFDKFPMSWYDDEFTRLMDLPVEYANRVEANR